MALELIDVGTDGWAEGLNFGEFFDEPHLVAATLIHLTAGLPPTAGYCLRFYDLDGRTWFEPYGGTGVAIQESKQVSLSLPQKIDSKRLHIDLHGWPALAWSVPDTQPPVFPDAVKRCQVRLCATNNPYMGYYKIVQIGGEPLTANRLKNAYWHTKLWLQEQVDHLRAVASQQAVEFGTTRQSIQDLLHRRLANDGLRVLTTLLSSQHGSHFNRAAVFLPNAQQELQCLYAHGGDDSAEWNSLRGYVADESPTVNDLLSKFRTATPQTDPLYRDLVGERVALSSSSLIARIWNAGMDAVPNDDTYSQRGTAEFSNDRFHFDGYYSQPIAAKITHADPWMLSHRQRKPNSAVFRSKNQLWFVVPWGLQDKPIGTYLFDLASWSQWNEVDDLLPKLRRAHELLKLFSADFEAASWDFS